MKFLVMAKWKVGIPQDPKMALGLNAMARQWIKANLSSKVLDCIYNVVPSSAGYYGMGIANHESLESLTANLASYPGFPVTDFEVYPLSDVMQALDSVDAAIKAMTGG